MKDVREFVGADARLWQASVQWRGMPAYRVLRFQTTGDVRVAEYRDDWEELPVERLRQILETEATPPSNDDEGLHGLTDAPGG